MLRPTSTFFPVHDPAEAKTQVLPIAGTQSGPRLKPTPNKPAAPVRSRDVRNQCRFDWNRTEEALQALAARFQARSEPIDLRGHVLAEPLDAEALLGLERDLAAYAFSNGRGSRQEAARLERLLRFLAEDRSVGSWEIPFLFTPASRQPCRLCGRPVAYRCRNGRMQAHEACGAARICRLKVRIFSGRLAIGEDFRTWFPRDEAADMNGIPCAHARTAARKRANTGWVQLDPGLEATFQRCGQDRFDVVLAPGLRGPIPAANAFADAALLPAGATKTAVLPCGLYAITLHDADPEAQAKGLLVRVRRIPEP